MNHTVSNQEPIDPKLMANQLHIDRSIEKANAGGEMKVAIKQEEPEQDTESTTEVVSNNEESIERETHETEYFEKKEVSLSDKVEDLTSATDRAKITEFMMNEASDFLDGFLRDAVSNEELKMYVKEYLTEQCLKKYSKSDPEVLKVMVEEFVEENNNEIVGSDEPEKRTSSPISVEELRNIEY